MPDNLSKHLASLLSQDQINALFGSLTDVLKYPRGDPIRDGVITAYDETMKVMIIAATASNSFYSPPSDYGYLISTPIAACYHPECDLMNFSSPFYFHLTCLASVLPGHCGFIVSMTHYCEPRSRSEAKMAPLFVYV